MAESANGHVLNWSLRGGQSKQFMVIAGGAKDYLGGVGERCRIALQRSVKYTRFNLYFALELEIRKGERGDGLIP